MLTTAIIFSLILSILIGRDATSPSDTDVEFNQIFETKNTKYEL
jgi:hypothetical protein